MLPPLILNINGNEHLANMLAQDLEGELGDLTHRYFPDGESYIRIESSVKNREVILVTDFSYPDAKTIPILFTAQTATSLGAYRVGLIAPYLPYMRQDKAFLPGEALSARYFSGLLSDAFDWMVTVDPHLHRVSDLAHLYALKPITLSATPVIVDWLKTHVAKPLILGPDRESYQWAEAVARDLNAPFIVASKSRYGDRAVKIDLPNPTQFKNHTPIIIDDVISTGTTLIEMIKVVKSFGLTSPICLAVHALFSNESHNQILLNGAQKVVTTNTIQHETNDLDVNGLISNAAKTFLAEVGQRPLGRYV